MYSFLCRCMSGVMNTLSRGLLSLCFLLMLCTSTTRAQSGMDRVGSARATALGHATTALLGDVGSQSNPAAASMAPRLVHVFARESYGLAELRRGGLNMVIPWADGAVTAGSGTFGFDAYREWYGSLGSAYRFGLGTSRSVHMGVRLRYYHTRIASYGQSGVIGLSAGSQVRLLPSLTFGVAATNLNAPQLIEGVDIPQLLAVGLSYEATAGFIVLMDAVKDIDFPLAVRGGLETRLLPSLALRAGFTTEPMRFTAGAGITVGRLAADVAAEQHQTLGWSPAVGLHVHW